MMKVTPDDVYVNVATIAFDIAELDMYPPHHQRGKAGDRVTGDRPEYGPADQ